jgi:hypothetical protein
MATVLEEQVYAVVATKTVNHQSHAGDDIDYEHCVEKESIHRFKNLCIIECLAPNIETIRLFCHISLLFFMRKMLIKTTFFTKIANFVLFPTKRY